MCLIGKIKSSSENENTHFRELHTSLQIALKASPVPALVV